MGNKEQRAGIVEKRPNAVVQPHSGQCAEERNFIDTINGHLDHVHCLFELNTEISLSQTLQLIKGEASYWANKQQLFPAKLYWADEYFAASVSESVLENVRAYINNQEAHHQKLSFADEYELFLQKQGLIKDKQ